MQSELGLIGLGVMGKSLARNFARNGFKLSLYNRHVDIEEVDVAENFILQYPALIESKGFDDLHAFIQSLSSPKKIFLMLPAGKATDKTLSHLLKLLSENDIIIDGGNTLYKDTENRQVAFKKKGINLIGAGISGGEAGALNGPSIMPSGNLNSYTAIKKYLLAIAAKDENGLPCCNYIGTGGAGHFVKMMHNGIEYAEMQLIAEMVFLLHHKAGYTYKQIADVFSKWNIAEARSYLLEITINILKTKQGETYILDIILDKAGNKGTGGWSTIAACEFGASGSMIAAALFARYVSAYKAERVQASNLYNVNSSTKKIVEDDLLHAYQISRIINHHQGFEIIKQASNQNGWDIKLDQLARIWTNGCIIRSKLMKDLVKLLNNEKPILMQAEIVKYILSNIKALQSVCVESLKLQTPLPCNQAAYQYLMAYITARGSANIIQAQRDYFGAHRYQKTDDPTGKFYHTNWEIYNL